MQILSLLKCFVPIQQAQFLARIETILEQQELEKTKHEQAKAPVCLCAFCVRPCMKGQNPCMMHTHVDTHGIHACQSNPVRSCVCVLVLVLMSCLCHTMQQMQAKLHGTGKCPLGYTWLKEKGGWRCAGGSHFVSESDLA